MVDAVRASPATNRKMMRKKNHIHHVNEAGSIVKPETATTAVVRKFGEVEAREVK